MYRVVFVVLAAGLASGCSMGTQQFGFGDTTATEFGGRGQTYRQSTLSTSDDANRSSPRSGSRQVASLQDRAPQGSFERPSHGALANRDYSGTSLQARNALRLINAYRSSKGLKPLALNASLTEAARNHSRDLAKWDRISHYGSDGSNPWDRVKRTGYPARLAAENVGTGQVTFKEVLKGWKDSPGHNRNLLLKDAQHMGIALVKDPNTEFKTFWTLVLGTRT